MMLGAFFKPQKNEAGGGTPAARADVCTLEAFWSVPMYIQTGKFKGLYAHMMLERYQEGAPKTDWSSTNIYINHSKQCLRGFETSGASEIPLWKTQFRLGFQGTFQVP